MPDQPTHVFHVPFRYEVTGVGEYWVAGDCVEAARQCLAKHHARAIVSKLEHEPIVDWNKAKYDGVVHDPTND